MFGYKLSGCGFESHCCHLTSDMVSVSSKEFLDIQASVVCRFTLKVVHDMLMTYSLFFCIRISSYFIFWLVEICTQSSFRIKEMLACPPANPYSFLWVLKLSIHNLNRVFITIYCLLWRSNLAKYYEEQQIQFLVSKIFELLLFLIKRVNQ